MRHDSLKPVPIIQRMPSLHLRALPAFTDNYIWMLHDGDQALVVDPGEAAPVHAALDAANLRLTGILVTHHHGDHVGGVNALRSRLEGSVHGPFDEPMPEPIELHADGDVVNLMGLRWQVLEVPGHTRGHIAYYAQPEGLDPILFCGDTLFSAGCGRLFEGTPAQMHASLSRLAALPPQTRVCCAHEYTLSNLRFAQAVEPSNADIERHMAWCIDQRKSDRPTLPSTIAIERRINPFLRCDSADAVHAARQHGAISTAAADVFAALRGWKNEFR